MGSALETLCGQAYGAGKMSMLGIYLQRSWVILLATAMLLSMTYVFATPILKLLGQIDEIAELAGSFSIWMIPELFAFAVNFPIQKFLQAQSKVMAMAWISAAIFVVHVILSWIFIIKLDMGLVGAAITLNFAWFLLDVGQLVYILSGSCKDSWTGFSWLAFTELVDFLGLSLASAVMLWSVFFHRFLSSSYLTSFYVYFISNNIFITFNEVYAYSRMSGCKRNKRNISSFEKKRIQDCVCFHQIRHLDHTKL